MGTLTMDTIRNYLIEVGCKIEYPILVNAFKKYLYNPDPKLQGHIRTQFKDNVNKLAVVSMENNMKFIILRPEFWPHEMNKHQHNQEIQQQPHPPPPPPLLPQAQQLSQAPPPQQPPRQSPRVPQHQPSLPQTLQHQLLPRTLQQQPPIQPKQQFKQPPPPLQQMPSLQPPVTPQRKNQQLRRSLYQSQNHHSSQQSLNQSQQQLHQQQVCGPMQRNWMIDACTLNYNNLLALLRKDRKLAQYRDIVNGYTALHWAAKFGDIDIIRLLGDTLTIAENVSVDIKSNAGYTPLHLAAMFNKQEAADLLIKTYRANPDIRDHSGKRPKQYWP